MNTHTITQQDTTIDVTVNNNRNTARQLTPDDILKIGEFRFLSLRRVVGKLDISKSTIYDWINEDSPRYDPTFPKPIKTNGKAIAWISNEVEDWMKSRIALSRGETNEEANTLPTH